MTYQTQRADLRGQGRRGTDLATGAPQVHWEKENISVAAEGAPALQPSLRIFLGLATPLVNFVTAPRASAGSQAGEPPPPWRGPLRAPRGAAVFG